MNCPYFIDGYSYNIYPEPTPPVNQDTHVHQQQQAYNPALTPHPHAYDPSQLMHPYAWTGGSEAIETLIQPVAQPPPQQLQQSPVHSDAISPAGNLRVQIPPNRANSAHVDASQPAPMAPANGPMSARVVVPQRPKPGRKPIFQEDAADRRRVQNRIAQRNFRDKRQQKLSEALHELEDKKRHYEEQISIAERNTDEARNKQNLAVRRAEAAEQRAATEQQRANAAEQRVHLLEKQIQSLQSNMHSSIGSFRLSGVVGQSPHVDQSVRTPPEDNPYETDFTNYGRTQSYNLRPTVSQDSTNQMEYSMDSQSSHDPCGFCTDDQNCACRPQKLAPPALDYPTNAPPSVPNSANKTMPGSCDACRADPQRAQACRDLASSAQMSYRTLPVPIPSAAAANASDTALGSGRGPFDNGTSRGATPSSRSSSMAPPRMSCSAMIDHFRRFGERTSSISRIYPGTLDAFPVPNGGFEFEEHQAAEVLSTLSRKSRGSTAAADSVVGSDNGGTD